MTTKKPREFWVSGWNMDEYLLDGKTTITVFVTANEPQRSEARLVREVQPEPTVDSINKLGKESYDQFLIRYHEKPDFAEAYLMGFRAALAWMKGEK